MINKILFSLEISALLAMQIALANIDLLEAEIVYTLLRSSQFHEYKNISLLCGLSFSVFF